MKLVFEQLLRTLLIVLSGVLLSSCVTPPTASESMAVVSAATNANSALDEDGETMGSNPPVDLLQGNYQQVPVVLAVQIKQINIVDTLRDDNDKIGYVASEVTGTVVESYKGDITPASMVQYRFSQEYYPEWVQNWKVGEQVLVFLTPANEGVLWVFDEAAQFPYTPELAASMQTVVANPVN